MPLQLDMADKAIPAEPKLRRRAVSLWVSTTYFAEGLPYMIVRSLSSVYFTDIGMREAVIGYLNWLGIPWNFKFLWAPLLDWFSTKRRWMLWIQGAIGVLVCLIALLTALGPPELTTPAGAAGQAARVSWADFARTIDPLTGLSHQAIVLAILGVFVLVAFFSSTHDIAIDAYYMEGIPAKADQAAYTGLRVMAYRMAILFARMVLLVLPTWLWGFGVGGLVLLVLWAFHALYLPRPAPQSAPPQERHRFLPHFVEAFTSYLKQEKAWLVLLFIASYKLGDDVLFAMNSPFLMRELGVTRAQLGTPLGVLGTIATIAGSLLGAWAIKRYGLKRTIWPLTLFMNLNIWVYVWLAWSKPTAASIDGLLLITALHGYENLAAGLGNAALVVFILYTCKPEFKATHYAIGSAIMSIGLTVFGGFTGILVEKIGYTNLYILAFLASLPSMALIFFLPAETLKTSS